MINSQVIKDLFLDAFWEVVYFPYWWYTAGLKKTALFCIKQVKGGWQATALSILFASFFKPMYAEKGFSAYFLSFIVRLFQISWRLISMVIWLGLWLAVLLLWLALPLLAIFKLIIG